MLYIFILVIPTIRSYGDNEGTYYKQSTRHVENKIILKEPLKECSLDKLPNHSNNEDLLLDNEFTLENMFSNDKDNQSEVDRLKKEIERNKNQLKEKDYQLAEKDKKLTELREIIIKTANENKNQTKQKMLLEKQIENWENNFISNSDFISKMKSLLEGSLSSNQIDIILGIYYNRLYYDYKKCLTINFFIQDEKNMQNGIKMKYLMHFP